MKLKLKRLAVMMFIMIAVLSIMTTSASASTVVIKGEVTKIVHQVSIGSSTVTVKDCNGQDHIFGIPLVEGEKLKVGDKVKVTVVKDANGNITSITIEKVKIESTDASGNIKDTFAKSEPVYLTGSGYIANTIYDVYIVEDTTWVDGMTIPSPVPGTITTIVADSDGKIDPTLAWSSALIGTYDVIVDEGGDGFYDACSDPLDDMDVNGAGFEAIPEFPTIALPVITILGLMFIVARRNEKGRKGN